MTPLGVENLDIYITGRCNYCCEYCYGETDTHGDMEQVTYQRCLDFAHYIGVTNIQLCGGEPLVCKKFASMVTLARDRKFGVVLRTNGILIDRYIDMIASECKWVGISLDGLPQDNAMMRSTRIKMSPDEQFQIPIKAVFSLRERNPDIGILLATLVSKRNYARIPDFARYLVAQNVPINKWKIYEFIIDKFRSIVNQDLFAMREDQFLEMGKEVQSVVGTKFEVQLQSSHTDRVAANCLIITQDGSINLMGKFYGNVLRNTFDSIIDGLLRDNALSVIAENKYVTYKEGKGGISL